MILTEEMLDESINVLDLPLRIVNGFDGNPVRDKSKSKSKKGRTVVRKKSGSEAIRVSTVRELLALTPEQVKAVSNFGDKTLETILERLARVGLAAHGYVVSPTSVELAAKKLGLEGFDFG